jgi:hypothetical protein
MMMEMMSLAILLQTTVVGINTIVLLIIGYQSFKDVKDIVRRR